MIDPPALRGGSPFFPEPVRFAAPTLDDADTVLADMRTVLESGHLTDGPFVQQLEERCAVEFGVDHVVAVSSNTIGLLLVIQAFDVRGPVLMPSFTFSATAHAARWNRAALTFADCDPNTWCLGPGDIRGEPEVIVGVHVSGGPCDVSGLEAAAAGAEARLIFDSAHGAGSRVVTESGVVPLGGFGTAEVFSLTPTKVLSSAEGGLVATNDAALAARLRIARNYGNPGDYNTLFPGLNARMSELHAVLALSGLDHLEERVLRRNHLAQIYRDGVAHLPGIEVQGVPAGARSSYKDFTIYIGPEFGCSRDTVVAALDAEGIPTRRYYSPPVHQQAAYSDVATPALEVTERLAAGVVTLPMWSHMPDEAAERVAAALVRIHAHAADLEPAPHV